jgi:hypothetical protein
MESSPFCYLYTSEVFNQEILEVGEPRTPNAFGGTAFAAASSDRIWAIK